MSGIVLCVVDMQPGFEASRSILKEVEREIKLAKQRDDWIVFIELSKERFGETHPCLVEAANSDAYGKIAYTHKTLNDGSAEFFDAIKSNNIPYEIIRICGVNRGACVLDTVRGLYSLIDCDSVIIELALAATAPGSSEWSIYSKSCDYGVNSYIDMVKYNNLKINDPTMEASGWRLKSILRKKLSKLFRTS